MKKFILGGVPALVFLLSLALTCPAWADPGTARDAAEKGTSVILSLLADPAFNDPATKADMRQKIEQELLSLFAFDEFSSRTVGPNWRQFSPDQRQRFQHAFTNLLRNTYIDTLDSYNGEQVAYSGELSSDNGTRVEIQMNFLGKEKTYPLAFRMLVKNDRWMVYDVLVEGISMIKNYRDQFRDILARGDAEALIRRIEEKAEEQKNNPSPLGARNAK
jgi:phospholipid transport system substrate-binding protein